MSYIITSEFELNKVAAPNLPLPPEDYNRQYFDQMLNILRLYFNRLDALTTQLQTSSGGAGIRLPYGAFQDTAYTTLNGGINNYNYCGQYRRIPNGRANSY